MKPVTDPTLLAELEGSSGKAVTDPSLIAQLEGKPGPTDWKALISKVAKDSFKKPFEFAKDLGTNPVSMAQAIPPLAGTVGGLSPIPGGATMGTVGGRQISNAALRTLGKPELIPSTMAQVGEAGLSALGDIAAIPAMKKAYFGKQIGRLEDAAGVPEAQDIPSIPMPTGTKSVGDFINDAVQSVKSSGGEGQPVYWKQIKDQVDRLYNMGIDEKLTTLDRGRLRWLNQQVQKGLNQAVPGRAIPANALAKSQTIPNAIGRMYGSLPKPLKAGAAYGTGVGAAGYTMYEVMKKLLGH